MERSITMNINNRLTKQESVMIRDLINEGWMLADINPAEKTEKVNADYSIFTFIRMWV